MSNEYPGPGPMNGIGRIVFAPRAPVVIDGATGRVIDYTIDDEAASHSCECPHQTLAKDNVGFGLTRKLLEVEPFRLAPWMTIELAQEEFDRQTYLKAQRNKS